MDLAAQFDQSLNTAIGQQVAASDNLMALSVEVARELEAMEHFKTGFTPVRILEAAMAAVRFSHEAVMQRAMNIGKAVSINAGAAASLANIPQIRETIKDLAMASIKAAVATHQHASREKAELEAGIIRDNTAPKIMGADEAYLQIAKAEAAAQRPAPAPLSPTDAQKQLQAHIDRVAIRSRN